MLLLERVELAPGELWCVDGTPQQHERERFELPQPWLSFAWRKCASIHSMPSGS